MPSKITETAADILARLAGKRADIARDEREVAELERAAAWAAGQERRDRLAALGAEAQRLTDAAAATSTRLRALSTDIVKAARAVRAETAEHNAALADIAARLRANGVNQHDDVTPWPSPANGGVAPAAGGGIAVSRHRVKPINPDVVIAAALDAAQRSGDLTPDTFTVQLQHQVPDFPPGARFFRNPTTDTVFLFDRDPQSADLVAIGQREYLARHWGVGVDDIPEDLWPVSAPAEDTDQ